MIILIGSYLNLYIGSRFFDIYVALVRSFSSGFFIILIAFN